MKNIMEYNLFITKGKVNNTSAKTRYQAFIYQNNVRLATWCVHNKMLMKGHHMACASTINNNIEFGRVTSGGTL
jgi:hypothetical protein